MTRFVLIVEDSEDCAETLEIALEHVLGIRTVRARTTRFAQQILNDAPQEAAAVITDLNLANSKGFDLVQWLRSDARFKGLPVILITGDSDPGLRSLAAANGVSAFFTKPYSPAEVRRKLEQLLC